MGFACFTWNLFGLEAQSIQPLAKTKSTSTCPENSFDIPELLATCPT